MGIIGFFLFIFLGAGACRGLNINWHTVTTHLNVVTAISALLFSAVLITLFELVKRKLE